MNFTKYVGPLLLTTGISIMTAAGFLENHYTNERVEEVYNNFPILESVENPQNPLQNNEFESAKQHLTSARRVPFKYNLMMLVGLVPALTGAGICCKKILNLPELDPDKQGVLYRYFNKRPSQSHAKSPPRLAKSPKISYQSPR